VQLIPISDRPSSEAGRSLGRLTLQTSVDGERHLFVPQRRAGHRSAPMFEATLAEACAAGAKDVVLDMAASSSSTPAA